MRYNRYNKPHVGGTNQTMMAITEPVGRRANARLRSIAVTAMPGWLFLYNTIQSLSEWVESLLRRLKNQKILVRQEGVLLDQCVASTFHLGFHAVGRDPRALGRAIRRVRAKVDDRNAAA